MKRCVSTFKFNFTLILFIVIRCSLSFAIVFFSFTQFSLLGHWFVPCVPFLAFISSSFFLNYFFFHFCYLFVHFFTIHSERIPLVVRVCGAVWICCYFYCVFILFFSSLFNTYNPNQENKQKVSSAVRSKFCIES